MFGIQDLSAISISRDDGSIIDDPYDLFAYLRLIFIEEMLFAFDLASYFFGFFFCFSVTQYL